MASVKKSITLAIIYIFNCFPIKKNKIFMFSYYGSQYGCNPKYISDYISQNSPKNKFDVVWAFNDPESRINMTSFRKVKIMSLRYFYELSTSKIVITNFRTTDLYVKRRNQFYIQTWHSSLRLKQIEKDAESLLPSDYVQMAKNDSLKCDLLLSGCKYSTEIFKRAFWYDGEIFEHGTPRNDVLFQNNLSRKGEIFEKLNVPYSSKVILYAPTFRKDNNLEVYNLDFSKISKKLKGKFGGEWIVLVKLHPHLISKSSQLIYEENVLDVTDYDDIQELLTISDVLITDYSSLMFDYSLTRRPCFLYVPDVKEYISQDRNLYFDLMELPFISATSNRDLINKIENFHYEEYKNGLNEFSKRIGSFEDGRACEYLLRRIDKICFSEKRSEHYEAV
ncbi:glycerophosphotransferase [Peribacillus cavernae]|uniref:Glycerophosphotransferase n=1 Tax=Peribacillus cavernae TaxID=1674310 RepID=A0A3S0UF37_9BACI|nr:CDP-glycerol glycerophosphotransferase family protein [Peribacillus cavernae]MDQ0217483.1 CDP-glycerol glycerophosphotransferase [Peribacillus cavernae]RUQ30075.1 glycerophosphotransferase [Peribacillus cavernae]